MITKALTCPSFPASVFTTYPYPAAITHPQVAYRRQYTPDLRSIKRKSIMPLRSLAVSGWRRFSRALIRFSAYSRAGFDMLDDVLEHGPKLLPLHRKLP